MGRLNGKVALITGSALGMGREHAKLFASEGAKIVVTDINEQAGLENVETITRAGGEAIFIQHDVASEDDWKRVVDKAVEAYSKVDILVNNAGILLSKSLEDTSVEEWDLVMNINLKGVFLGCRAIIPAMKIAGGGSIVNISSIYGIVGAPDCAAYEASKGGVRLLTKSAAVDLIKHNIRVNSIHPGGVETPMVTQLRPEGSEAIESPSSNVPLGRIGQPEDIAKLALFLASDDSAYSSGGEFIIDGGMTAGFTIGS